MLPSLDDEKEIANGGDLNGFKKYLG